MPACLNQTVAISTHTPLAGRDVSVSGRYVISAKFLLTRPLRDVTVPESCTARFGLFLLTRPLRDVTLLGDSYGTGYTPISTHTPLAGRDKA